MSSRTLTASIANLATPGGFHDGDWVESKDQDPLGDIRLLQLADVGDGDFRDRSSRWINDEAFARLGCSWVLPGDVLVARMPDPIGRACVVPDDIGRAITVVDVAVLRCDPERAYNRYVMYAINEDSTRQGFELIQDGATRQRIPRKRLGRAQVPLPQLDEQRAIAEFLDEQTLRINTLIAKQNQLITTLREHRDAYLGQQFGAQGGQRVTSVRRVLRPLLRLAPLGLGVITAYRDGEVTLRSSRREDGYTFSDTEAGYQEIRPGDLVFHALDGFAGACGVSDSNGVGSPVYHVCEPTQGDDTAYLALLLRYLGTSGFLATQAPNVRQRSVDFRNWSTFAQVPLTLPSPDEQRAFVKEYAARRRRVDSLIAKTQEHVALAQERRSALITAAVTGQIAVRTAGRTAGAA